MVKSDLSKVKEILDHQSPKGVKSGDWKLLKYIQREELNQNGLDLVIESVEIVFSFNKKGRLVGMYSWQE